MADESTPPAIGDLKVWYIPQVPGTPYEVNVIRHNGQSYSSYLERAAEILEAITNFSIFEFENNIKPDYSDAGGISRWEGNGNDGFDWYDVDEEEYERAE